MDRGHFGGVAFLVYSILATTLLLAVVIRAPAAEIPALARDLLPLLAKGVLPYSISVNGVLAYIVWNNRKKYTAETGRLAAEKRLLQERLGVKVDHSDYRIEGK